MSYKYRYVLKCGEPALKCPKCSNNWTDEYSITLGISCGERVTEFATCLSKDGQLFDVDRVVANGYHSYTECADCGEQLFNLDGVLEEVEEG